MKRVQSIMDVIQKAEGENDKGDASNTFKSLEDVDWGVQPYSIMTKTAYVEFNPSDPRAKLPACFTKDLGPFMREYVIFQDPKKNHIQVEVQKKNTKNYFARGWSRLREFYGLCAGGWITILYISPLLFHIRVRRLTGLEVDYPEKTPPHRLMLPEGDRNDNLRGPVPFFVSPTKFYHVLEKSLFADDVESGSLKLMRGGFCENALPGEGCTITLVDWMGYTWDCLYDFGDSSKKTCLITGAWADICKKRRLVEGMTVKFGVTSTSDNKVLHFKMAPFIGVRTTLIGPRVAAGYKAFYQTENYFLL